MIRIVFILFLCLFLFIPLYQVVRKIIAYCKAEIEVEANKEEIDEIKAKKKAIVSNLKEEEQLLKKKEKTNKKLLEEINK